MLDTVVISGKHVCCSVVFGTLVGVFSCPLWSSVCECQRVECATTSPARTECGMFVMHCLEKVYNVCNCDMFSVVNVYLDHLNLCVVCVNDRMYVCCSEYDVVSNECNEPTPCLVQPIGTHGGEVMYFGCFCFRFPEL